MNLLEIRRTIVTAVASDDFLMEQLVLKGGNALELAYQIGNRASVDIDYSMQDEFGDVSAVKEKLFRRLRDRFDARGFVLFDEEFGPRPPSAGVGVRWGGYRATFKLATKELFLRLGDNLEKLRRTAVEVDATHRRIFTIDISRYEYVGATAEVEIDSYMVRVYQPIAIAIEKLRALCQQMTEYTQRANPAPRARDVYDIYAIVEDRKLILTSSENLLLVQAIFAAKEVDLSLLALLDDYREFHRGNWPSVTDAVRLPVKEYDFYYSFVSSLALEVLKGLRIVDPPL